MTQPDVVKVAGGTVVGLVIGALLFAGVSPFRGGGDEETEITLSPIGAGNACVLGKSTQIRVRKSKHVTWEIRNYCTDGDKVVWVGNFRKTEAPVGANNCESPGADYPFTEADRRSATLKAASMDDDGSVDPTEESIKLKVKDKKDLGETELVYYFDVCLGDRKADPVLVIER